MSRPNALKALPPIWFRFTDEQDKKTYGDRWYVYDESELMLTRTQALVLIEDELGMPLPEAMNAFRASSVRGDASASWLGVRRVDRAMAGDFDEFDVITNMIEWTSVDPAPKDEPAEALPDVPPDLPSESTTSAPTDTVVLPAMPVVG